MSKHRGSRASFIAALDIGDSAVFEAMPGNGSRLMQQIGVTARRAKMNSPMIYSAEQLSNWPVQTRSSDPAVVPKMVRPYGWQGVFLLHRIRLAWGVFVGRYDAIRWNA